MELRIDVQRLMPSSPGGPGKGAPGPADVRAAFEHFDEVYGNKGHFTHAELQQIMGQLGPEPMQPEEVTVFLGRIDINHDGIVDLNEVVRWLMVPRTIADVRMMIAEQNESVRSPADAKDGGVADFWRSIVAPSDTEAFWKRLPSGSHSIAGSADMATEIKSRKLDTFHVLQLERFWQWWQDEVGAGKSLSKQYFTAAIPLPEDCFEEDEWAVTSVYEALDSNQNGEINFEEVMLLFGLLYRGTEHEKMRFMFDNLLSLQDDGTRGEKSGGRMKLDRLSQALRGLIRVGRGTEGRTQFKFLFERGKRDCSYDEFVAAAQKSDTDGARLGSWNLKHKIKTDTFISKFCEAPGDAIHGLADASVATLITSGLNLPLTLKMEILLDTAKRPKLFDIYMARQSFQDMSVDSALRNFLGDHLLPADPAAVEKVLMGFSNRYKSCNESCPLSVDGVYMLSFNIIMLLTNTHNIGVRTKMTIDEFVTSLEGTTAECAVDLDSVYGRCVAEPLKMHLMLPASAKVPKGAPMHPSFSWTLFISVLESLLPDVLVPSREAPALALALVAY